MLSSLDGYRGSASLFYDEVLHSVSEHAQSRHSLGKVEIGALVAWKRINGSTAWMRSFMATPDVEVRKATARAYESATTIASVPEAVDAALARLKQKLTRDTFW